MNIVLAILNAFLLTIGQMLFKLGVNKIGKVNLNYSTIVKMITNKYIVAGVILYGFTTFLWLYILSRVEFNKVYPIQSLAFVFALFISIIVLKETVTFNRWVGVMIICLGTYVACYK